MRLSLTKDRHEDEDVVSEPIVEKVVVKKKPGRPKKVVAKKVNKLDTCLFCGGPKRYERFVNLQTIALCENDYYDKTVGKIVAKLKEIEDGSKKAKESNE